MQGAKGAALHAECQRTGDMILDTHMADSQWTLGKGGEFQDPYDLLRLSSPKQRIFLTAALCGASARQCGIGEMSGVQAPLVFLSPCTHGDTALPGLFT